MKRLILAFALPLMLVLLGCDGSISPTAPDETLAAQQPATSVGAVSSVGATSAASAPISFPIFEEFDDVNFCTGEVHTVTITGTAWLHANRNNTVIRSDRTITTSSGFEGRGHSTQVVNISGNIFKLTLNDMLTQSSGAKIRVQFVLVVDTSSGTVHVGQFSGSCVRP